MAINMTKNMEDITKQVLDINRNYINKSIDVIGLLKEAGSSKKITNINQDLVADIFNGIVKLNLEYYAKLVDFGFSVTNQILSPSQESSTGSSFTLSGKVKPGEMITLQFVLDNPKSEAVLCELQYSFFLNIDDQTENLEISAKFSPQSFQLEPEKSMTIDILCPVSKTSKLGTYYSHVKVVGFEPAYFTIILTIEKPITRNVSKKNQSDKNPESKT
ncbi:hypothetical protein ACI513_06920 [Chryseobacterium sp. M5]|uniref:hypothetical protein n=1 Tax=Chryseobacterium sp. M5 TaxID=3379128 RepID=UPI0038579894